MAYCARQDIEDLFGRLNVQTWANLDNGDVEDPGTLADIAARIERAIEWATAYIDKRFRGSRYAVPLTALPGQSLADITDIAARLAGVWLYEARGIDEQDPDGRPLNRLDVHRRHAERQIRRYLAGMDDLPAVRVDANGPTAPFVAGC